MPNEIANETTHSLEGFSPVERVQLESLRARYDENWRAEFLEDRDRNRILFTRWLYQTGRLGS